ncbi:virulence-associated protein E [Variibacter gotjawalensis]|uniref:Virulence-associated protein E n=1 Tax=Variibacter gotjawalensis TaxID=1333996 RepID=A0A0S3PXG1_9BRAD|nr:VapE domain-containing protein [Variibacter gotjawalensis]NIK46449.1 hypothetical protein [Variibacter gotjawalensis]RZS48359.1 primase-like protein [Variibacter gotjawalensis]BAT60617.1 virulence-associated protein E [Variibacter gotjawalensis]
MSSTIRLPIAYYQRIGAALFPILPGQKEPTGIVGSFAADCSKSASQWLAWDKANPGCNFGVVAGNSRLIFVDVDIGEVGRERAWQLCVEWFTSRGLPAPKPYCQSASGGWHFAFRVPDNLDVSTLRQVALVGKQPDTKKAVVDTRVYNGYVVAAGSQVDDKPYVLMNNEEPPVAPPALLEHVVRAPAARSAISKVGERDPADVGKVLSWLVEREQFTDYDSWLTVGMALKAEFGDDGFELWRVTFDDTVTDEIAQAKWDSFSYEVETHSVTLATFLQRAHALGWKGTVRKSTAAMFNGVTPGAMPMTGGQEALGQIGLPLLEKVARVPRQEHHPAVPDNCTSPMVSALNAAIPSMIADPIQNVEALALLKAAHETTYDAVCALSPTIDRSAVSRAVNHFYGLTRRSLMSFDDFQRDARGNVDNSNSDNIRILLAKRGIEIRFNAWKNCIEVRGDRWQAWTVLRDTVVAALRTVAASTGSNYNPPESLLWAALETIARENEIDPAVDKLAEMQAAWDKQSRLETWLTQTLGVPNDAYHTAVGRNLIGGMTRRIRQPGCKHDTMVVLTGFQGSGKSTLVAILALNEQWFTDSIKLGDESKDLILSLAGKSIVEISEMGRRGNSNANAVKAMLSKTADEGRPAYARSNETRPRRNIFIGTTNQERFLVDDTGNRRFLPVMVTQRINLDWLRANLDQLVGEAAHYEAQGETFALPESVWSMASERQEDAREVQSFEMYLDDIVARMEANSFVSAADLQTALRHATGQNITFSVQSFMSARGFKYTTRALPGRSGKSKLWVRGPMSEGQMYVASAVGGVSPVTAAPPSNVIHMQGRVPA